MSSQSRINSYMEKHRIGEIFEDLMNKVLRDMPEEPMIYLMRAMYKKAGMEIPQNIRYGGVRKSTSDVIRNASPERPSRSAQGVSGDVGASRDYDKPWVTTTASRTRVKPKKSEDASTSKARPEWNADLKSSTKMTSLDQFWEEAQPLKRDKSPSRAAKKNTVTRKSGTSASAWASVGLSDNGETYTSPPAQSAHLTPGYTRLSEKELLDMERVSLSRRSEDAPPSSSFAGISGRHSRGPKQDVERHRKELSQWLTEADKKSDDSGIGQELRCFDDGDAIELLENADDLRREGVTNIPKSGYRLSQAIRLRENEPRVKLNINVNPEIHSNSLWQENISPVPGYDTYRSSPETQRDSDEEFESVSQVTGPRRPVWDTPDSDGEGAGPTPSYSMQNPQRARREQRNYTEKSLRATAPARYFDRSVDSADDLTATAKTWTDGANQVSFREEEAAPLSAHSRQSLSTTSGWRMPDDTEIASAYDWNRRVKGSVPADPRAY